MKKKELGAIFITALILSLQLLSNTLVFARESLDSEGDTAALLDYSDESEASTRVDEPVREERETAAVHETADTANYDKNVVIEILNGSTCTKVTLDEYLIMVVMSEMPYTFEAEALKAQAVAARTYTLKLFEDATRHPKNTVCTDPSHCSAGLDREAYIQKYGADEYEKAYSAVAEAVHATDGVVITYEDELCTAVYHSGSSGRTENSYNLWGTYTPYLVSVTTPETAEPQTVSVSAEKFVTRVFKGAGESDDINIVRNDTGRCEKITVGEIEVSAGKIRTALGLKSSAFDLTRDGDEIIFTVYGYGHGIGMSQYGANELARTGANYIDILTHYYTGVEVVRLEFLPT